MVMVVRNHVIVVTMLFVMQMQQMSMTAVFVIRDMKNHFVKNVQMHVVRRSIFWFNSELFFLVTNNTCNNVTEDCLSDPNSGLAICNCKDGYAKNSTNASCTGMNEYNNEDLLIEFSN